MNQVFSYSKIVARDGINGATALKFNSNRGKGFFYVQTSGNEDQFRLSVYKSTGTASLSIPAVTFTSSEYALHLNPNPSGAYVLNRQQPDML